MRLTDELAQAAQSEYVPMTQKETWRLIRLSRKGGEGGQEANTTLIKRNIRMIIKSASRYKFAVSASLTEDDLFQLALLAFQNAVRLYDPKRGIRFSTYATWAMNRACSRGLSNHGHGLRLPVHIQRRLRKIREAVSTLQAHHPKPTYAQIASVTGFSEMQVTRALNMPVVAYSLDEPDLSGKATRGENMLSDEAHNLLQGHDTAKRQGLIEFLRLSLAPRCFQILCWYNGLDPDYPDGLSLSEIGKRLGITRQRVEQLMSRAERQLAAPMFADRLREFLDQDSDVHFPDSHAS